MCSAATIVAGKNAVQKQEEGDWRGVDVACRSYDELLDEIFIYIAPLKTRDGLKKKEKRETQVTRGQRAK